MAYTGKTDWILNDIVMPADMNRIEQGIEDVDTALTDLEVSEIPTLGVNFDTTTPMAVTTQGQMAWNANEETIDLGLIGGSVLSLGQELMYHAINQTGATITDGTVVMADGVLGASGKIKIAKAVANGSVPSEYIMGVATQDIANGDTGYVTCFGIVRGINTTGASVSETWADGDMLYANPFIAGALTKVKPSAPNLKMLIAIVIKAGVNGTLLVRPTFGTVLGGTDSNVQFTNPQTGDIITYNATTGIWTNSNALSSKQNYNANNAMFKKGSFTYTDNDTSQTFTDAFCTTDSLVTIVITSLTNPQGFWSVNSANGSFTITSTAAESSDITFDYYIQKAVG